MADVNRKHCVCAPQEDGRRSGMGTRVNIQGYERLIVEVLDSK